LFIEALRNLERRSFSGQCTEEKHCTLIIKKKTKIISFK